MKPYKLRRWRWKDGESTRYFFTCARPGRTSKETSKNMRVPDNVVNRWLLSLPGPRTSIVCLLGRKPDGMSEYKFYSFYGGYDKPEERPGRKSFRQWLNQQHNVPKIELREYPTTDFEKVADDMRESASQCVTELLRQGHTVVLVDSGGDQRTGQVCRYMGAAEDSSSG
jgi:hypothetical protein